eukprot:CAMPEP_0185754774 /NCGR_PEP_ID=MMETSP1174-20130828/13375_1 /TAXON_ID=35687 /ORGANISM="Dictyocha speculum, Strain CCMP1381" /LENGTH=500 /DNA_ID=CAMNT_0028433123 /DNA_START=88 /DNA_END=1590 /DNA_ORIENTATION=+
MLISETARQGFDKEVIQRIWKVLCGYINDTLLMSKGLKIPHFGNFTLIKSSGMSSSSNRDKSRVFYLASSFARLYGVPPVKVQREILAPCLELNWTKLAVKGNVDKDTAQNILQGMIRSLGEAIASGQAVRIQFESIGAFTVQKREPTFRFTGYSSDTLDRAVITRGVQALTSRLDQNTGPESKAQSPPPTASSLKSSLSADPMSGAMLQGRPCTAAQQRPPEMKKASSPPLGGTTSSRNKKASLHASSSSPTRNTFSRGTDGYVGDQRPQRAYQMMIPQGPKLLDPAGDCAVFPKLVPLVEQLAIGRSRVNYPLLKSNISTAYSRLKEKLDGEKDEMQRLDNDIQSRQELTTKILRDRAYRKQMEHRDLQDFLVRQSQEAEERREQQRRDDLWTVNPAPERAHPMNQRLDPELEKGLQRTLKDALDEQVNLRGMMDQTIAHHEKQREARIMENLKQEVYQDRVAALHKKLSDQRVLAEEWARQKELRAAAQSLSVAGKI